ncbi:MAG: 50S ribosomal protein L6 [Bacteroidota bacterium]
MPRIGSQPINIPQEIDFSISKDHVVTVKSAKAASMQAIHPDIIVKQENDTVTLEIPTQQKRHKSLQGLYRSLIQNMVTGLTKGFSKTLEIIGIGYKVNNPKPQLFEFHLGYSHTINFLLPEEIEATIQSKGKNPTLTLKSHDKQLLGQVTAKIRSLRKPEPYKGKGIRIQGEYVRRKQGKTASG